MPGDQEEDRVEAEVVADDGVDDVPGPAEIEGKRAGVEDVGEEAVEHRRPHDRVVLLHAHDVDGEGDHVGATGEGYAGDDVEADPEAPGILLRQVGYRPQALGEADDEDPQTQENDGHGDHVEGRQNLAPRPELGAEEAPQSTLFTDGSHLAHGLSPLVLSRMTDQSSSSDPDIWFSPYSSAGKPKSTSGTP